jgi:hypothetical protein
VSAEDFCTVVARAEAALAAERQPVLTKEEIVAASDGDHIEVSEAERGNFMTANGKLWILESVAAKAVMRGEERLMDAEATLTAERQRIKLALEAANELPLSGIWQKRARIIELLSEVKK